MTIRYELLSGRNGHPELGDTVYKGEEKVGKVSFFYNRPDANEWNWLVQIDPEFEHDPCLVRAVVVNNDNDDAIGRRFMVVGKPSMQQITNNKAVGNPTIQILNNVEG